MSKAHRTTRPPAPSPASGGPAEDLAPQSNAAMIEAINGGDGAGAAREAPTPEFVSLVALHPRPGVGATAEMGVEYGVGAFSPFEGLQVEEHFGPIRMIPGLFSEDDLTDHPNAPRTEEAFAATLDTGDAGVFTVDCLGTFIDHHHGGGLPIQYGGWLTPQALARGVGYEFDQTYTANGETIGSFVVQRLVSVGRVDVDKIPTGRSGYHTEGRAGSVWSP